MVVIFSLAPVEQVFKLSTFFFIRRLFLPHSYPPHTRDDQTGSILIYICRNVTALVIYCICTNIVFLFKVFQERSWWNLKCDCTCNKASKQALPSLNKCFVMIVNNLCSFEWNELEHNYQSLHQMNACMIDYQHLLSL